MIYGFKARVAFLILAALTLTIYLVNALIATEFVNPTILGWVFVFFLFGANFSRISRDRQADRRSRDVALTYGFIVTVATLMGYSFTQMVSSRPADGDVGGAFLFVALIANVVFLGAQYLTYWSDNTDSSQSDDTLDG